MDKTNPEKRGGATSRAPTLYRILDANSNRASEGLRTLEEAARFVLDHLTLTEQLKSLRHELATACGLLPRNRLLAARNTPGDVGTKVSVDSEGSRSDVSTVVAAATNRTQQALRCLEEYGKCLSPDFASQIESIRYRAYAVFAALEQQLSGDPSRHEKLAAARLYALIDGGASCDELESRIRQLGAAGVSIVQLRDRNLDDRRLFDRAVCGAKVSRECGILFIVNDRADIALAAGADGVHVGQDELPVDAARSILGDDRLIGLSTHNLEQVDQAMAVGANYIGCGPVFPSQTKTFAEFPGCAFLRDVANRFRTETAPMPSFAIGGIDCENVEQVVNAGLGRIAVTGVLGVGTNVTGNAQRILDSLGRVPLSRDDISCEAANAEVGRKC